MSQSGTKKAACYSLVIYFNSHNISQSMEHTKVSLCWTTVYVCILSFVPRGMTCNYTAANMSWSSKNLVEELFNGTDRHAPPAWPETTYVKVLLQDTDYTRQKFQMSSEKKLSKCPVKKLRNVLRRFSFSPDIKCPVKSQNVRRSSK